MATQTEILDTVRRTDGREDSMAMLVRQLKESITGIIGGTVPPDVMARVHQEFDSYERSAPELCEALDDTAKEDKRQRAPRNASTAGLGGPTLDVIPDRDDPGPARPTRPSLPCR